MDDSELGTALQDAAPQVSTPTGLAGHRERILAEARARRGRRLRLWGASAVTTIALVAGGSVAMAVGNYQTPWGWVADNVFAIDDAEGHPCFQGLTVEWEGFEENDPIVQDAKAILSSMDLEDFDTTELEAQLRADHADAVDVNRNPIASPISDAEIRQNAIGQLAAEKLWAEIAARGHEMSPDHYVSLGGQTGFCE